MLAPSRDRTSAVLRYAETMRLRPLLAAAISTLAIAACAAFDSAEGADTIDPSFDAAAGATGDAAASADASSPPPADSGEGGLPDSGEPIYGDPNSNMVACGGGSCSAPGNLCCAGTQTGCRASEGGSPCTDVPLACDGDEDCTSGKCRAVLNGSAIASTGCVNDGPLGANERQTCHQTSDCDSGGDLVCAPVQCGDATFGVCVASTGKEPPTCGA